MAAATGAGDCVFGAKLVPLVVAIAAKPADSLLEKKLKPLVGFAGEAAGVADSLGICGGWYASGELVRAACLLRKLGGRDKREDESNLSSVAGGKPAASSGFVEASGSWLWDPGSGDGLVRERRVGSSEESD